MEDARLDLVDEVDPESPEYHEVQKQFAHSYCRGGGSIWSHDCSMSLDDPAFRKCAEGLRDASRRLHRSIREGMDRATARAEHDREVVRLKRAYEQDIDTAVLSALIRYHPDDKVMELPDNYGDVQLDHFRQLQCYETRASTRELHKPAKQCYKHNIAAAMERHATLVSDGMDKVEADKALAHYVARARDTLDADVGKLDRMFDQAF